MASRAAAAARFFTAFSKWNNMMRTESLPCRGRVTLTRRRFPLHIHQSRLTCRAFATSHPRLKSSVGVQNGKKELDSGDSEDTAKDGSETEQSQESKSPAHFKKSRRLGSAPTETIPDGADDLTITRPVIRHVKITSQTPSVMRELMRSVPHPVVVVTASSWNAESQQMAHQAMTISSFNTVTLDPMPIISFNIRTPSRTFDAILAEKGHFRIHVLSNSQRGSFIADAFTRGNAEEGFKKVQASGVTIRFPAGNLPGVPTITGKAVLATLNCILLPSKRITIQDHVVALAQVTHIIRNKKSKMALMYVDRAYRKIGEPIMAHQMQDDKGSGTAPKHQEEHLKERAASDSTSVDKANDSPESAGSVSDLAKWQNDAERHARTEAHMRFMTEEAKTESTQKEEAVSPLKDNGSASSFVRKHNSGPYISKVQKERKAKRVKEMERFKSLKAAMLKRNQDIDERERMKQGAGEQVKEG